MATADEVSSHVIPRLLHFIYSHLMVHVTRIHRAEDEAEGSSKKRAALAPGSSDTDALAEPIQTATSAEIKSEPDGLAVAKSEPVGDTLADSAPLSKPAQTSTPVVEATPEPVEPTSKFEEPQNRFRIYFESPPELDRIPKAIRRGNNKRWRRESSSVAPTTGAGAGATPTRGEEVASAPLNEDSAPSENAAEGDLPVVVKEEVENFQAAEEGEPVPTDDRDIGVPAITTSHAGVDAVQEPVATNNGASVAGTAGEVGPAEDAEASYEEHAGDVSMRTDADIDAFMDSLEEQVGTATAATNTSKSATQSAEPVEPYTNGDVPAVVAADPVPDAETTNIPDIPSEPRNEAESGTHADADGDDAVSAIDSALEPALVASTEPQPSVNRISILYEESSRRICVDADAVESVRIHRAEGKIEVCLRAETREAGKEGEVETAEGELRKGVLVSQMEVYDTTDERFVGLSASRLAEIYASSVPGASSESSDPSPTSESIPPLHHSGSMTITVWLNKKRPLSEPKWCRSNAADEWLFETFTAQRSGIVNSEAASTGWRGKLQVVDPDPAPTLQSILGGWTTTAMMGNLGERRIFIDSLTATNDAADLLEILLRLARGDRNPTYGGGSGGGGGFGSLSAAVKPDSPFASHQTHVSLAVLQMYRLTMAYADKAGEGEAVREKVEDIVRSLPVGMIQRSLDGLFREWAERRSAASK
jgi:20S proteasome subunit alpha 6